MKRITPLHTPWKHSVYYPIGDGRLPKQWLSTSMEAGFGHRVLKAWETFANLHFAREHHCMAWTLRMAFLIWPQAVDVEASVSIYATPKALWIPDILAEKGGIYLLIGDAGTVWNPDVLHNILWLFCHQWIWRDSWGGNIQCWGR